MRDLDAPTQVFAYEETTKSKLSFFSLIFDDFEGYIQSYWETTQSEKWDDVDVLPESFRIDYIDNQFTEDFEDEDDRRLAIELQGGDEDAYWTDFEHVNTFTIKFYQENKEAVMKDVRDGKRGNGGGVIWDWGLSDDLEEITITTLARWSWIYHSRSYYSWMIKENFSCDTGIPLEEIQKENISINGS